MINSLATLQDAVSSAWGPDTCDPRDLADWHQGNPARGQCGVTALVIQDLLGGDLIIGEVRYTDGTKQGVHYWNRVGLLELDLTRQQFAHDEHVGPGTVVQRPPGPPNFHPEGYEVLRSRTLSALGELDTTSGARTSG